MTTPILHSVFAAILTNNLTHCSDTGTDMKHLQNFNWTYGVQLIENLISGCLFAIYNAKSGTILYYTPW